MNLQLVSLEEQYRPQLVDMLDEWSQTGEKMVPYAIRKNDYHDFAHYLAGLNETEDGEVPGSTYFCLDVDRNIFVGAVNIRHFSDNALLVDGEYIEDRKHIGDGGHIGDCKNVVDGGHIGDGVRPSERRRGIATQMIGLALEKCKELGIRKVLMVCDKDNISSAKSIRNNGGVLESEMDMDGEIVQKYWIDLD